MRIKGERMYRIKGESQKKLEFFDEKMKSQSDEPWLHNVLGCLKVKPY